MKSALTMDMTKRQKRGVIFGHGELSKAIYAELRHVEGGRFRAGKQGFELAEEVAICSYS